MRISTLMNAPIVPATKQRKKVCVVSVFGGSNLSPNQSASASPVPSAAQTAAPATMPQK